VGRRSGSRGNAGGGEPALLTLSTASTRHSSVGNRTGCHQSVRRGRATRYLMHAVFGCSGLAGPLAAGLGESDDDGERGCRKSDVAGGQGGHCVDPRRAAPACDPYRDPMFLDDVLECFRIVSLGPQRRGGSGPRIRSNSASELARASALALRFADTFCRPGSSKPWLAPG
jgi:hypothetical protein